MTRSKAVRETLPTTSAPAIEPGSAAAAKARPLR
jgi:hypothetical protein